MFLINPKKLPRQKSATTPVIVGGIYEPIKWGYPVIALSNINCRLRITDKN
jgi:hypothetical protein